ncbi:hypothetical protein CYMTET_31496 [Cymbomonas tetramitiformis]|uniref:Uncharacterized protein n=1 Tax=Cymbomonas tetramitiformis TaxID=36881 RepID=A0AAE0FH00_9CHLO|nr:hypothetical protein CYMTET_31496 [Cymbomonas tetramitiformis]
MQVAAPLMKTKRLDMLDTESPKQSAIAAASWFLRTNFQLCMWAVEIVGGMVVAAKTEDEFGTIQLRDLSLGAMTSSLLSCLLALRLVVAHAEECRGMLGGGGLLSLPPTSSVGFPKCVPLCAQRSRRNHREVSDQVDQNVLRALYKPTCALADMVQGALYRVVREYGDNLLGALEHYNAETCAKQPPPSGTFGSYIQRRDLLKSMLSQCR